MWTSRTDDSLRKKSPMSELVLDCHGLRKVQRLSETWQLATNRPARVAFACPGRFRLPELQTCMRLRSAMKSCTKDVHHPPYHTKLLTAQSIRLEARSEGISPLLRHSAICQDLPSLHTTSHYPPKMKLLICLVLAAVAATTTCGQAPAVSGERPNELLDGLKVLSDILTDAKFRGYVSGYNHVGHD